MIAFRNVSKSFGARRVLDNVSFEIAKGEIGFVLGTSGTGKSVLLKTLVGLLKPDSGRVEIDGEDISGFKERELLPVRRRCGMVFQQPALFDSQNVFENVAFGVRRHFPENDGARITERVRQALALVHLRDCEKRMPQELSFGMQKRVSLARALALNPDILLFDEPTTGLDPITTGTVNALIKELSRELKTTSLVVSHDIGSALALGQQIIFLDQGRIVARGSPAAIRASTQPLVKAFLLEVDDAG